MTAGCSKFLKKRGMFILDRLLLCTFLQTVFIYVVEGKNYDVAL